MPLIRERNATSIFALSVGHSVNGADALKKPVNLLNYRNEYPAARPICDIECTETLAEVTEPALTMSALRGQDCAPFPSTFRSLPCSPLALTHASG